MDLNDLLPKSDTVVVPLVIKEKELMNEDGTPMTVEMYLPHTKEYKAARHAQADVILGKGEEKPKSAEYEEMALEFLAATTKSWNITFGGEQPKFTKKKAKELYEKLPVIPELLRSKVEETEGFI